MDINEYLRSSLNTENNFEANSHSVVNDCVYFEVKLSSGFRVSFECKIFRNQQRWS